MELTNIDVLKILQIGVIGLAFLEKKGGDYLGYRIGVVDDPDLNAVICPVFTKRNFSMKIGLIRRREIV